MQADASWFRDTENNRNIANPVIDQMKLDRKMEGEGARGSACLDGGGFKQGAWRRAQEDEGASHADVGGVCAGSGMESRQDRKLWGHEQRRVMGDLAFNRATMTAVLRTHCREPRPSRQRDEGSAVMDVVIVQRGLECWSGVSGILRVERLGLW